MMGTTLRAVPLLVLLAALSACKQDYPQCDRFVDFAVRCDDDMKAAPEGEQRQARMLIEGMCAEAFKNDTSGVNGSARELVTEMYAELRERADCSATANTCEQYAKCTETN